ncbi:hypothetical protein G6F19_012708 [Rhizopus arrhizus]|nr:hypothetical protein G6F19_012708 [Rhizopus arrhizus]KAG0927247.1 hypothetical protein G6F32_012941 [Rhizopus arrhizus]KAG1367402.1 hypothetical protein G6F61_012941 [Rhizopus arrhizus]
MLWGCMTCNGPGYACTIEDGTMKASDHVHILSATLMDSLNYYGYKQEAIYFQQDNDPKHTSKLAQAWFKENGLKEEHTFHWPAQSPHLDPIEHLWHHLKLRLSMYEGRAKGVHDLWSRIEEEWSSFTKEQCQAYIKNKLLYETEPWAVYLKNHIPLVHGKALENIKKAQLRQKRAYNKGSKVKYDYKAGDLIARKVLIKTGFPKERWSGPWVVIKASNPEETAFHIHAKGDPNNKSTANAKFMRPWFTQDERMALVSESSSGRGDGVTFRL